MNDLDKKLELAKLRRIVASQLKLSFDGLVPGSLPTAEQEAVLRSESPINWVISGNRAGKTTCGGRIVSWWFNDEHPYIKRPKLWGSGSFNIIVVGRLQEQIESEIWEKKIRPFLAEGSYETKTVGGALKSATHLKTGNKILFFSHHDAVNARDKVQAFTAPVVWVDEMPSDSGIITELVMRTVTLQGFFYATFTPLIENDDIYRLVETPSPYAKKHHLTLLQNPMFKGRETEVEGQIRSICATEAEYRARMYGEWYRSSDQVFRLPANCFRELPTHYHRGWRHFAVVDPAASGTVGMLLCAEDPTTGDWYVVFAKYLQGSAAFDLVQDVEKSIDGYNVRWKLTDCNPAGFYKEALRVGKPWRPVADKKDRKVETIEKTNEVLASGRLLLTSGADLLKSEATKCKWADSGEDKIRKASRFHTLDCLRYFVDNLPVFERGKDLPLTETQAIRREWHKRREVAARKANVKILGGRSKLWASSKF
jgi:hypothetical protein